jgi:hypothetical protein
MAPSTTPVNDHIISPEFRIPVEIIWCRDPIDQLVSLCNFPQLY